MTLLPQNWTIALRPLSLQRIAETLNAEGVPSPRDVKWAICDIRRITKEAAYRDTIIDADIFDAAQNEMSERSKA